MAILKAVNVKIGKNASLKGIINYVLQKEKTEEHLTTGICCDVPIALETFLDTKQGFGKLTGRQYYHFVQSFPPNENITTQQAHELAIKFVESCKKLRGFEILVVTHKDRKHIHTHFIIVIGGFGSLIIILIIIIVIIKKKKKNKTIEQSNNLNI